MTATLSVLAGQLTVSLVCVSPEIEGAPGAEGAVLSASDEPVTEAAGLALPAASNALTS